MSEGINNYHKQIRPHARSRRDRRRLARLPLPRPDDEPLRAGVGLDRRQNGMRRAPERSRRLDGGGAAGARRVDEDNREALLNAAVNGETDEVLRLLGLGVSVDCQDSVSRERAIRSRGAVADFAPRERELAAPRIWPTGAHRWGSIEQPALTPRRQWEMTIELPTPRLRRRHSRAASIESNAFLALGR